MDWIDQDKKKSLSSTCPTSEYDLTKPLFIEMKTNYTIIDTANKKHLLTVILNNKKEDPNDIPKNPNKNGALSFDRYSENKLHFSVDIKGLGISKGDKLRVSTLAYSDKDNREADYGDGLEFIAQNSDSLDVNLSDFTFSLLTDIEDWKAINELPIQDRSTRMFEIIGKRPYQGLSMCIQKVTKDNGHVVNGQTYYGNVIGECRFVSNKNYVIHSPFSLKSSKVESEGDKKKVSIQVEGTIHENTVIFFEYVKTGLPILPYLNYSAKVYATKESDNTISFLVPDNITEGEQNIVVVTFGKDGYSQVARLDFSL